jgi:hypothetical protein
MARIEDLQQPVNQQVISVINDSDSVTHSVLYQSFFSPTDAQLDNIKNNFKFA